MERISSLGVRSESCCEEKPVVSAQTYPVGEESLLQDGPPPETSSSFTALLGLPANQALELLHSPESEESPAMATAEILKGRRNDKLTLTYSLNCSPAFSSKAALAERVSRLSIFAATEGSPETSSVPSNSSENSSRLKNEPTDSDSNPALSPILSDPTIVNKNRRSGKRKERQIKVKGSAKKSKQAENESSKNEDKLPYVHVRARRGQATDSHSLAERARREKINARMKLLQELVPGCNKVSFTKKEDKKADASVKESTKSPERSHPTANGWKSHDAIVHDSPPYYIKKPSRKRRLVPPTLEPNTFSVGFDLYMKWIGVHVTSMTKISGTALVLDEIINHVQSLQRKVEFLSMKLAAINPRINFGLESFFVPESGFLASSNFPSTIMSSMWPDAQINGITQQQQNHHQQLWPADMFQQPLWSRDSQNGSIVPESSLFGYNSANSASLLANQLKMET